MFTIKIIICHYQTDPEGATTIYIRIQLQLLSYILSNMTRAWGMAASFVYKFYFLSIEIDLGPTFSPLPLTGSVFQFLSVLFITMVLSVEEALMYFGYAYAPNLTPQGSSVITKILSMTSHANDYRNKKMKNNY
jgi:hypothetical protein